MKARILIHINIHNISLRKKSLFKIDNTILNNILIFFIHEKTVRKYGKSKVFVFCFFFNTMLDFA